MCTATPIGVLELRNDDRGRWNTTENARWNAVLTRIPKLQSWSDILAAAIAFELLSLKTERGCETLKPQAEVPL